MRKIEDYEIIDIAKNTLYHLEGGVEAIKRLKEAFEALHEKENRQK